MRVNPPPAYKWYRKGNGPFQNGNSPGRDVTLMTSDPSSASVAEVCPTASARHKCGLRLHQEAVGRLHATSEVIDG